MMTPALLLLALLSGASAAPPQSTGCGSDCLGALRNPTHAVEASSLCSIILETTVAPTATGALPTWATQSCAGPLGPVLKLSKACSRFLTTAAPSSWSSASSSVPSSWPGVSSTSKTSEPTGISTCPAASTETTTETVTESASAIASSCPAASTITLPYVTITEPGTTVTESCSISTTTTTETSIRTSTSTTTVTTPSPSTCAQLLGNPSFSNPSRELFPWLGAISPGGPGTSGGLGEDLFNDPGNFYFVTRAVRGTTPSTQNPFVRLTQGISTCAGIYTVRIRFQVRDSLADSPGGWVFRVNLRMSGGSTVFSSEVSGGETALEWTTRETGMSWALAGGTGEFWVDVVPVEPWDGDTTVWVDRVELVRL